MMLQKACTKCGATKPLDDFHRCSRRASGRKSACKECANRSSREYHEKAKKNPDFLERARKRAREHYWKDPESRRKASHEYRKNNHEAFKQSLRNWYSKNKQKVSEYGKLRYAQNKESISRVQAEWRRRNREKARSYSINWYHNNKRKKDVAARLAVRKVLSDFLYRAKSSKQGRTCDVLGYSSEKLKARMECQFKPGMTWENHGEWHIDHKIPVSHFIARGETRPHIVNALSNLQPLWARENLQKHNRWTG